LARGHSGPVLDTAWAPFNATGSLVASAGEDGKILLWDLEREISGVSRGLGNYNGVFEGWNEEGWTCPPDFTHISSLSKAGGGRKVGQIVWNPVSSGILASASGDHLVKIWDMENSSDEGKPVVELKGHKDTIQSIAWDYWGKNIITVSR
jgi:coronin-1B/1C/6